MRKSLFLLLVCCLVMLASGCRRDHQRRAVEDAAPEVVTTANAPTPTGLSQEIQLPPGLIHLHAQWVGQSLWVESYDPNTKACLFREYRDGKAVESGGKVLMKGCRVAFAPEVQVELAEPHHTPATAAAGKSAAKVPANKAPAK